MKIAITSQEPDLDGSMDPRFGRAAYILIVNSDSLDYQALDNSENRNAFQGAGIQAASNIVAAGAQALVTGYCGPKAFQVLAAAGVKVFDDVSGSVRDAIAACSRGELKPADGANAEAHWG